MKQGVSSPHENEPTQATPPAEPYHAEVTVSITRILLLAGALKNAVESVVTFILKGR